MSGSEPHRAKNLRVAAVIVPVLLLVVLGFGLHKSVTIEVNGVEQTVSTFALTVGQLLSQSGIPVVEGDWLEPGAEEWLSEGSVVRLDRASSVVIQDGSDTYHLFTPEKVPANLLKMAGVSIKPGDQLFEGGRQVESDQAMERAPVYALSVHRSFELTLQEGEQQHNLDSAEGSIGQAIWQAGFKVFTTDRLDPAFDTALTGPAMQAALTRSREVTIQVGNTEVEVRTAALTVGEALSEAGIGLQALDYSIPPEAATVPPDGRIRVVRVTEGVIIEQTPLPFETEYQAVEDLELDSQTIVEPGTYGLSARRVRVRYEDGLEVSRLVEDEWIALEPQNRIVGYGTLVVMKTIDTPDGPINYWRALTMWITSYNDSVGEITATGQRVRKGLVGVNPGYIPYGTMMYVPGYGYAEAADTGNIGPRWIDLGYPEEDYVAWHQYSTVYFLWPPPANILWIYPP